MTPAVTKAFFAGTFNPVTTGHLDIVARGLRMFPGGVTLGIGYNERKGQADADTRVEELKRLFAECPRVEVTAYSDLTATAARRAGASVILRGYRNAADAEYERTLAETNLRLFGIDTALLATRGELSSVSSSMVRELEHFGVDTSRFRPTPEECRAACAGEAPTHDKP